MAVLFPPQHFITFLYITFVQWKDVTHAVWGQICISKIKQGAVAGPPMRGLLAEKQPRGKEVQQLRYLQGSKTFQMYQLVPLMAKWFSSYLNFRNASEIHLYLKDQI